MEQIQIHKMLESDQVKNFWHDLKEESLLNVEFLDAAICFAVIKNLARTHGNMDQS